MVLVVMVVPLVMLVLLVLLVVMLRIIVTSVPDQVEVVVLLEKLFGVITATHGQTVQQPELIMEAIPNIVIPKVEKIETISIPLPTADVPYYEPMVVPPSDLRDQEEEPVKTVEETPEPPTLKIPFIKQPVPQPSAEVVVAAVTTAVTAVAATTLTQPLIENIRKRAQKFIQGKINKWRQNRQKRKDSSQSSKKT